MPRLLNVMGAKDRVGASTAAWELALHMHLRGTKVLLIDANADHLGDLQWIGGKGEAWRVLEDLKKVPRPVNPNWLASFLKGPQDVACLKLAALNLEESWKIFSEIFASFDWVICDAGSRFNASSSFLLARSSFLLFILNPDLSLLSEMKRKLEELALNFFPRKQIGWMAKAWGTGSFLNLESVSEDLKIRCLGENVKEVASQLELLPQPASSSPPAIAQEMPEGFREEILKLAQEEMKKEGLQENSKEELRPKVQKILLRVLEEKSEVSHIEDRASLIHSLLDELLGLGPLEPLLTDDQLTEILVNGTDSIYVEENGKLKLLPFRFTTRDSLQRVIERILLPLGRRVDESSPMVDARLSCGSRVHIILPPLALEGPILSIRRFSNKALSPQDWVRLESADESILKFLEEAVFAKKNILVSGGTGSGKTTLLNLLSSFIPKDERIVTIEDAAELRLNQPHRVRLETRPPNIEGKGEITIRDLVRNALRMRPDRIVVGECRGGEALDMLTAMNTGHAGSLTTLHANNPRDALRRLETLVLFAGIELPLKAVRESIVSAMDLIIQVGRLANGARKILSITEVEGLEDQTYTLRDLFGYADGEFQKFLI